MPKQCQMFHGRQSVTLHPILTRGHATRKRVYLSKLKILLVPYIVVRDRGGHRKGGGGGSDMNNQ